MASFEKRGDYQWRAKVRRQGQPIISKTFDTRKDAEDWAREVERKIKRGEIDDLDPSTQKTTVTAAIKSYKAEVVPSLARKGVGTVNVYLSRLEYRQHHIQGCTTERRLHFHWSDVAGPQTSGQ